MRYTVLLCVTLVALGVVAYTKRQSPVVTPEPGDEFVCYADGVLTERHVGVRSVWWYSGINVALITYTDGQEGHYTPAQGETCQVETL